MENDVGNVGIDNELRQNHDYGEIDPQREKREWE